MPKIQELLHQGRKEELWQMCCGFIDLGMEQFMAIQKRLLLEQIELLKDCELGRKVMRGAVPETVEEFREQVPLTTFVDYCPELKEQREDALPAKPVVWQHTSGRSSEYPFNWETIKWVPLSSRFYHELAMMLLGSGLFASCSERGDTSALKEHLKFIYAVAPRPYTSGVFAHIVQETITGDCLPSLEEAETLSFEERIQLGFQQALSQGFDLYFGVSIALVAIGERINQQLGNVDIRPLLSHPKALFRLVRGLIKSKLARRPMLPKDLWSVKTIVGSGTDGIIFKEKINELWGKYPLDLYSCTEAGIIATQTWDYDSMTFVPNLNFLEFIPEAEYSKWQLDHSYQPRAVLLDEVKAGENYELVITNFHGSPLVRYRMGDIVKITALRNEKLGIDIPQMAFEGRVDDIIDIGGFVRLTEKVIWQAVENSGIPYEDWTARREMVGGRPVLRLYLELKDNYIASEKGTATAVYEQLKRLDDGFIYGDVESILGSNPIEVSLLPEGAFSKYISQRRDEGADLAHLKPRHINPSERELSVLGAKVEAVPEVKVVAEAEAEAAAKR